MGLINQYAVLEKSVLIPSHASAGEGWGGGVFWYHRSCYKALFTLVCLMSALRFANAQEDASSYLQFVEEFPTGVCSQRQGKAVLIKSTHLTRKIKVVLDRFNSGVGTGDRSRSVLEPGAEPEALGCSRSDVGAQEWRVFKAEFVE
jgi:hypothetical protein